MSKTKTISVEESTWEVLKSYRRKLAAERHEEQTFSDVIAYLIERDSTDASKEVSV